MNGILEAKREIVAATQRNIHNEKLHNLCSLSNVIEVIN
jgi:hypothetical protein